MTSTLVVGPGDAVDVVPAVSAALRRGEPVVLQLGTGEHQLVIAAERVTARAMAALVRYSSGFACVAVEGERLAALDIPLMDADDPDREAFAVSVDAVAGLTTGISAHERARTARALADPATGPEDLVRPGHVVPVRVRAGGVLERAAAPEAAADLCRIAGLAPVAVFAAIPDSDNQPLPSALRDLASVRVEDVVRHRERVESPIRRAGVAPLTTRHGSFTRHSYVDLRSGAEHLAIVAGDVAGRHAVHVRVHTECLAGDLLGSVQCCCASNLEDALDGMAAAGCGVVVYVRSGSTCAERAPSAGEAPDTTQRDRTAAHVLRALDVRSAVLLSDDPADAAGLTAFGMPVMGRVPLPRTARPAVWTL